MSKNQRRARQATYLVVGKVLSSLSEAMVPMLLVRFLPTTEVGVLSAMMLLYAIIAPVLTAAFPGTLMYYLPTRSAPERRSIAKHIAAILLGLGAVAAGLMVALGLFALWSPELLRRLTDQVVGGTSAVGPSGLKYMLVLALLPLGDLPSRILPNLLVVEDRAQAAAGVGVIKSLGMTTATLVPILLGWDLWYVVASISVFGLSYGALTLYYLRALYPHPDRVASPLHTGELVSFAFPLGLTDITATLNAKLDQFLIMLAFAAAMVAQYRVGAWQMPLVTTIAYAVGNVYVPHFTRMFSEGRGREVIQTWRLSIRKVSLIVVPMALVFVVAAEETIELLFTADYLRAANVFRAYCLLSMGRVAAFGAVIVAAGRPKLVFQAAALSLAANVGISIPLLLLLGFEGPAIGTALAFVPMVMAYCWCIARAYDMRFSEIFPLADYLKVVALGAVAAGVATAFKLNAPCGPALRLAGVAAVLFSVFVALGAATRLIGREDWLFMGQWFSRKLRRQAE